MFQLPLFSRSSRARPSSGAVLLSTRPSTRIKATRFICLTVISSFREASCTRLHSRPRIEDGRQDVGLTLALYKFSPPDTMPFVSLGFEPRCSYPSARMLKSAQDVRLSALLSFLIHQRPALAGVMACHLENSGITGTSNQEV